MAEFTLKICTDNDAFHPDPAPELADILSSLAQRINENGIKEDDLFDVRDVNGNKVGNMLYE